MYNKTVHADAVLALADLKGAFARLATATAYLRHADGGGELRDRRPSDAYSLVCDAEWATLAAVRMIESFVADQGPLEASEADLAAWIGGRRHRETACPAGTVAPGLEARIASTEENQHV